MRAKKEPPAEGLGPQTKLLSVKSPASPFPLVVSFTKSHSTIKLKHPSFREEVKTFFQEGTPTKPCPFQS